MRVKTKHALSLLFFLLPVLFLYSQNAAKNVFNLQLPSSGNTYAVIVGIAKYESTGIPQLEFPDRDAIVFSDYLKSKAGGSIPEQNIRLLTNETATFAAIYDALNWLLETCQENDVVYFYFSGHGDMENNTIYKFGFLLSYNTPRNNYINSAVRLEDLNAIANTLSAKRKAKVILITDACHSGKLAGSDFHRNSLVGDQLRTVKANEVRITSCEPDQLSNEDQAWGGGRGVFSYYLINGLTGLADKEPDGIVTVDEIKNYLNSSLSADVVLAQKKEKQDPVVNGDLDFKLATVDNTSLNSLKQRFSSGIIVQSSAPPIFLKALPVQPQGYFFNLIGKNDLETLVDFNKLDQLSNDEVPFAFIKMLTDSIRKKTSQQFVDSLKVRIDTTKIYQLEQSLRENKDALKRFNEKLVVTLSDRGQEIINEYLDGDAAELEKRRYYSNSNGYDVYPKMFSVALKLTAPENQLYKILQVKLHYFSGVAARLKMPMVEDQKPLLDLAIAEQTKAFALEENAAYIQNELGILNLYKAKYTEAEKYFFRATQIAPTWAIPWANLCGLYAQTKDFKKAFDAGHIADSIQPDLQTTKVNLGFANEFSGNFLFAEEDYRKSIDINSRHYLPFERLGYVYMNTTQYAVADSFFYEADIRKKGYHFNGNVWKYLPVVAVEPISMRGRCEVDTNKIKKNDFMAFFTWGLQNYYDSNYKNALAGFKRVIAIDRTNPLVFHYMGKIYYDQKNWEAAEVMFKYAIEYYRDENAFNKYCDSVIQSVKYPYPHDCFENYFHDSYYEEIEDYNFISKVYESWAHYEEAEKYFRAIIALKPDWVDGYIKLWQMMEKLQRYPEAEKVIQSYASMNKETGERELNAFYRRMIKRFPDQADWYYRLGLLLYPRAQQPSRAAYFDSLVYFPLLNREVFVDLDIYYKLQTDPNFIIPGKSANGLPQIIELKTIQEMAASVTLPGTNETIPLADAIYTPRKDAIGFLSKAADRLTDNETVADLYFKIANVFIWAGSKKQAYLNYEKSVQLMPENAAMRLRAIDIGKALYKNRETFENLDYLYANKEINFPDRMLLAEFCIHSSQFDSAKKILAEAEAIYPYVVPEIADLSGRLNLLSHQPLAAIPFYKNYLNTNKNDCSTLYTISKLYVQSKNMNEAWKWLKSSIDNGFKYYWVLKLDPTWNAYRNTSQWKELTEKITPIDYAHTSN